GRAGVVGVLQELLDDADAAGVRADEAAEADREPLSLAEVLADDPVLCVHLAPPPAAATTPPTATILAPGASPGIGKESRELLISPRRRDMATLPHCAKIAPTCPHGQDARI